MDPKTFFSMAKGLAGDGKENTIHLPAPQNAYDRLLNNINRTGRPLLLVAAVAFFIWAIMDPTYFITVMAALKTTPDFVQTAILTVIALFGTGRVIQDIRKKHTVKQQIAAAAPVVEDPAKHGRFANTTETDLDDKGEMPVENSAISAWKSGKGK